MASSSSSSSVAIQSAASSAKITSTTATTANSSIITSTTTFATTKTTTATTSDGVTVDTTSLYALLREVQLEHFYRAITAIDVTKIEHFENVVFEDLVSPQVGMGAPAARRLLEAAKRRNSGSKWRKNLLNIILPNISATIPKAGSGSAAAAASSKPISKEAAAKMAENSISSNDTGVGLTCLIPHADIRLMDKIGDGSFGVVMRAQWTQPNTRIVTQVAVKVLKQEVILRALEDFAKEVNSMHQLRHRNLIRLYGIVLSSPMMMVTELAAQGSLRAKLAKTLGRISLSTLIDFAAQIATGMDYLETRRLIHRDLATRNIFLADSNVIKIGDFGLMRSVPFGEDYYTMSDNNRVPFPWCAIESLKYRQFSHASDTWMYGVTLWELFSFGQEPWAGFNGSQIIKKLEQNDRLPRPDACSARIYHVMSLCWKREPNERPTFASMIAYFTHAKPIRLKASGDFDSGSARFAAYHPRPTTGGGGGGLDDKNGTKAIITPSKTSKISSSSSSSSSSQPSIEGSRKYLKISSGDEIEVVEGVAHHYWWKGQNQRTFDVGYFPRCIAKDCRGAGGGGLGSLSRDDISKPLRHSFIHTGHMDPMGRKSWGNPEFIEKMYLEHPIEPPDVLGIHDPDPSEQQQQQQLQIASSSFVDLETRGGERKHWKENDDSGGVKIYKILNIDELESNDKSSAKFGGGERRSSLPSQPPKEDILIDFNTEISPATPTTTTTTTGNLTDEQRDLFATNFDLPSSQRSPPPLPLQSPIGSKKSTTDLITRDLFEMPPLLSAQDDDRKSNGNDQNVANNGGDDEDDDLLVIETTTSLAAAQTSSSIPTTTTTATITTTTKSNKSNEQQQQKQSLNEPYASDTFLAKFKQQMEANSAIFGFTAAPASKKCITASKMAPPPRPRPPSFKYYIPPSASSSSSASALDCDTISNKNGGGRYYSSVCSNFDFSVTGNETTTTNSANFDPDIFAPTNVPHQNGHQNSIDFNFASSSSTTTTINHAHSNHHSYYPESFAYPVISTAAVPPPIHQGSSSVSSPSSPLSLPPPPPPPPSIPPAAAPAPTCNCCSEYFTGSSSYLTNCSHCTFDTCTDISCGGGGTLPNSISAYSSSSFNGDHAAAKPPQAYNSNFASISSISTTTATTGTTAATYQSKICKEFIEELEANFASMAIGVGTVADDYGQNGGEYFNDSFPATNTMQQHQQQQQFRAHLAHGAPQQSVRFPVSINPPPRPYKTRRPAPPPPVLKKVN